MLVIDYSHMSFRMLYTSIKQFEDGNFAFFRHIFLQSLYSLIVEFQDNNVVLAVDMGSWRKKFYEEYKAHRKIERKKSDIDFPAFFAFSKQFTKELEDVFPVAIVKVRWAEADDIFGTIAMHSDKIDALQEGEKIVFVSSDKDMQQVKLHQDCVVYDPIKRTEMLQGATHETLQFNHTLKIMLGDKGDNIPNVKRGVGEKTAAKLINERNLDEWLDMEPERREAFKRNEKLICFSKIPQIMQDAIVVATNAATIVSQSKVSDTLNMSLRGYYKTHALMRLNENVDSHVNMFARKMSQQVDSYDVEQIVNDILGDTVNAQ